MTTSKNMLFITLAVFGTSHALEPNNPVSINSSASNATVIEFEENKGQFDSLVAFVGHLPDYQIQILKNGTANFQFNTDHMDNSRQTITFDFLPDVIPSTVAGNQPTKHQVNYLAGTRDHWITNVLNYQQVALTYESLGIDLVFYENMGRLEYDFKIKPHVDPKLIQVSIDGIESIEMNDSGQLVLQNAQHKFIQHKPYAYQLNKEGEQVNIPVSYRLVAGGFGFNVANYDPSEPLIIDPIIEYSTYVGGLGNDRSLAIDIDANDNIYQLSTTSSPNLSTAGAYQDNQSTIRRTIERSLACSPCVDGRIIRNEITGRTHSLLITKYSADGKNKLYSTYITSPSEQSLTFTGYNLKTSENGEVAISMHNLFVDDLPLVNPITSYSENNINGYVAKLNATGDDLVFATYLTLGSDGFYGVIRAIDISPTGEVALVGNVSAGQMQDTQALEINPIAGQSCVLNFDAGDWFDGYIMKFNAIGQVTFASCLGGETVNLGSNVEGMREVKFSADGKLYVVGRSGAIDLPVVNGFQPTPSPNRPDLYLAVINPTNSQIEWSSYYGASSGSNTFVLEDIYDDFPNSDFIYPYELLLDSDENFIIVGRTNINTFNSTNVYQPNLNYPDAFDPSKTDNYGLFADFFVLKVNPNTGADWFTYLGGSHEELGFLDAAIDQQNHIYLYGMTTSTDYPLSNALQNTANGKERAVLSKLTNQGGLAFSTYFGGSDERRTIRPGGIAINSQNKIILGGQSEADDFPVSVDGDPRVFGFDATLSVIDQSDLSDSDGDGVPDNTDAFPADASEWQNNDNDSEGNNIDQDDDNDNVTDATDHFPYHANKQSDDDTDGVANSLDFLHDNSNEVFDTDGDGQGDRLDSDADNDGFDDEVDAFMIDPTEFADTDNDGIGNSADPDDDGDGTLDESDADDFNTDIPIFTFEEFNPSGPLPINFLLPYGFDQVAETDKLWAVDNSQWFQGKQSLASLPIDDNQSAGLKYEGPLRDGMLSFYYKIDSELNHDFLTFTLDGQELLNVSGDVDWTEFSTPITAGNHILTWVYQKDGAISVGEDSAAIDHISGLLTQPVDIAAYITPYDLNYTPILLPAGEEFIHQIDVYNYESTPTENVSVTVNLGTAEFIENTLYSCFAFNNSADTDFCDQTPRPINNSETFQMRFDSNGHMRFYIHSLVSINESEVIFSVSASANEAVLDIDLSNNDETVSYPIGIFGSGFE